MTQPAVSRPTPGHYMSLLEKEQDRKQVIERVAKETAEEASIKRKAIIDGLGLYPAPPAERLAHYASRPMTNAEYIQRLTAWTNDPQAQAMTPAPMKSWEELRARWPRRAAREGADFERLLARQAEGTL